MRIGSADAIGMANIPRSAYDTILTRWEITAEQLTQAIDDNPSLRGMLFGYVAEHKASEWFTEKSGITGKVKYDDHDRGRKGDLVVTYKDRPFIVECKSLQTNTIKQRDDGVWTAKCQCDASDRRTVTLADGSELSTTCLVAGEFDLLAVNAFAFKDHWHFAFAKNDDLPRSGYKRYTEAQRRQLLATLVTVTWPPEPPFRAEPYSLMDELIRSA